MSAPPSNAIIAVLVIGYVYRLWTHRHTATGD
jgi:hypothetical protein